MWLFALSMQTNQYAHYISYKHKPYNNSFLLNKNDVFMRKSQTKTGLQITVGHQPLADQNLLMSDEIPNVIGHDVRTNILS